MTTDNFVAFVKQLRELGVTTFGGAPPGEPPENGVHIVLGPVPSKATDGQAQLAPIAPAVPNEVADLRKAAGLSDAAIADLHETLSG